MSAGTPGLRVRIDPQLRAGMRFVIAHRNMYSRDVPWDESAFVRKAILEKIAKMERSRQPRPRRTARRPASATIGSATADQSAAQSECE